MNQFFKKNVILIIFLILNAGLVFSQPHPSENGDGSPVGGDPVGGRAPLGNGLTTTLILAGGYCLKRIYDNWRVQK